MTISFSVLFIASLIGTFVLTAVSCAFRGMRLHRSKQELETLELSFVYSQFARLFSKQHDFEALFFTTLWAKNIMRFFFASFSVFLALSLTSTPYAIAGAILIALLLFLFCGDYIPRMWALHHPETVISTLAFFSSFLLILLSPLTSLLLLFSHLLPSKHSLFSAGALTSIPMQRVKAKIFEILEGAKESADLDADEKKLITSIITFRDRIAREVMVPRTKIFAIDASTTIITAVHLFETEGYSRVPVYRDTIDNIIGVLMFRDIIAYYMRYQKQCNDETCLKDSVERIMKKAYYTPETKKVSSILKEFRNRQVHLAVVVDEYGGTSGIVTIEDILEELVGDIADEYDTDEQDLFTTRPEGGWIVDASMTILEIGDTLGIRIAQDGDYDTLGGYIFHKAGAIPSPGFVIHHDAFDIEVLRSTDRSIEDVRITPVDPERNERTNLLEQ